jgi:hypothetical protein
MQRLYRARLRVIDDLKQPPLPDRLPGLSRLSQLERVKIDLHLVRTSLTQVGSQLSWPADARPDPSGLDGCLDVFEPVQQGARTRPVATGDPLQDYRNAVLVLHMAIITAIFGSSPMCGKAYNLGRALADTFRSGQRDTDIQDSFQPYRLSQLRQDLLDLSSTLPEHSAQAVSQSLTWWRDAAYLADSSPEGESRRRLVGSVRTTAPGLRRGPAGLATPKVARAEPQGSTAELVEVLPRQGELFRLVLTGSKVPTDLLTVDDYILAGRRALARTGTFLMKAMAAAKAQFLSGLILLTGILGVLLAVVFESQTTSGGKLAALLAAVGGYVWTLMKAVSVRLKGVATSLEKPIWGATVDLACAEAISLPPVGQPDKAGWTHLEARGPEPAQVGT